MTPEKATHAEELFALALELPEPERAAFLDQRCGSDSQLRAEIESLLRWHQLAEAESFEIPSSPGAEAVPALAEIRARTLAFRRLGPFELQQCLGEGATGIVYRALDTRSGEIVALKIASPETLSEPRNRERFRRAAEASIGIHHRHIARVLETGAVENLSYVALEYVEGHTLAEELKARRFDRSTTLRLARQIAEALAAAHGHGIIHRDLKPANIMLTRDGHVKVLDLGLCHAFAGAESIAQTETGVALGTLGYMAPEQARGLSPTPQSDLFSFGALLLEMLAGRPAFPGDSPVAILSAVLHDRPKRFPGASWPLDLALWCLEKDPSRRPDSAARVLAEIQRLERRQVSTRLLARRLALNPRKTMPAAALLAAFFIGLPFAFHAPSSRHVPVATAITPDENVLNTDPAISPDRNWIAFASNRAADGYMDLWMAPAAGGNPRRLTYAEINARQPEFSADGRSLVYRSDRDGGGIFRVPLDGPATGTSRMLVPGGLRPRISPDGRRMAYWLGVETSGDILASGASQVYVARADGSAMRQICPDFAAAAYPIWSADGSRLLFAGRRASADKLTAAALWMTSVERCDAMPIGEARDFPGFTSLQPAVPERWVRGGRLFFRGELERQLALGEVTFSERTGHILNPVHQLAVPVASGHALAILDDTTIAYAESEREASLWSMPLDRPGAGAAEPQRLVQCASEICIPAVSTDGAWLFYSHLRANGRWEIVRRNLHNAAQETVQSPGDYSPWPFMDGHGHDLLFLSRIRDELYNGARLSEKNSSSSVVCPRCPELWDVAPSTRYALSMAGDGIRQVGLIELPSGTRKPLLSHPQWSLYRASFSPDESSIVFTAKLAPGRSQIFVCRFQEGQCSPDWTPIAAATGYSGPAHWSASGDRIYFASLADGHRCFYARAWDRAAQRPSGPILALRHFHSTSPSPGLIPQSLFGFAVARDKLVFPMSEQRGRIWLVH